MLRFLLKISVEGLQHTDAQALLSHFVRSERDQYGLSISEETDRDSLPHPRQAVAHAETLISIPFTEKETVRIHFNIFASQFESEHPEEPNVFFRMESA